MDFEISLADNGKYIICKVNIPITTEVAVAFRKEMDVCSREHGIKRFLVDVRAVRNMASVLDNYNYAYEDLPATELKHGARDAILSAVGDDSHDVVETMSKNAGFYVRNFKDEAEAIRWLLA